MERLSAGRPDPRTATRGARAFTLVELLVVIAVIGVLVAMLLPAIQSAREAARRNSCSNNLKQLGLALNQYVDGKRSYPPGQNTTCNSCDPWAWSAVILPFMELSELYSLISFRYQPNDQNFSLPATGTLIPVYLCPSTGGIVDPSRDDSNRLTNYYGQSASKAGLKMACSDYAGIEGPNNSNTNPATGAAYPTNLGVLLKSTMPAGVISMAPVVQPREITDGLSNTIIVAEMAGRGFNAKSSKLKISGTWADGYNTANVKLAFSGPPGPVTFGPGKLPDSTVYSSWCPAFASDELISYHPNGGNVLMCDGSVHFVSQDVDPSILWALCSRKGGEAIDDPWADK